MVVSFVIEEKVTKRLFFFKNNKERTTIEKSLNNIEKRFKRKLMFKQKNFQCFMEVKNITKIIIKETL